MNRAVGRADEVNRRRIFGVACPVDTYGSGSLVVWISLENGIGIGIIAGFADVESERS